MAQFPNVASMMGGKVIKTNNSFDTQTWPHYHIHATENYLSVVKEGELTWRAMGKIK
jgi:hypothetical protein